MGGMDTTRLTLRLPKEDVDFAKRYAQAHRITLAELVDRHLRSLQALGGSVHPEVERMTGVLAGPGSEEPRESYHEHILAKNR